MSKQKIHVGTKARESEHIFIKIKKSHWWCWCQSL